MGKIRSISILIFALSCIASTSSCEKIQEFVKGGEAVRFTGEINRSSYGTKAQYSGDTTGTKEPIYWSEGDVVRIYCSKVDTSEIHNYYVDVLKKACAGAPNCYIADYVISGLDSSGGDQADIVLNSDTTPVGLRWNQNASTTHTFYGVYPAPSVGGATRSPGVNGVTIYGNLANEQNTLSGALSGNESDGYVLAPDMKWMLMYGKSKSYTRSTFPSDGSILINFQPVTTAIQFTITNDVDDTDLVISKLELISSTQQIWGKYKVSKSNVNLDDGYPSIAYSSGSASANNTVSLSFASPYVTIKPDKTFTFTFFLAPVADVTDLSLKITRSDGSSMATRLGYTDGTNITFERCKKSFVKGILVPEGVQWTIDYTTSLTDWVNGGNTDVSLN